VVWTPVSDLGAWFRLGTDFIFKLIGRGGDEVREGGGSDDIMAALRSSSFFFFSFSRICFSFAVIPIKAEGRRDMV